jgi:tetratricopeptide (TPR) repeat protein
MDFLLPEKVDSQTRLINYILKTKAESNQQKFCLFLGAGCSVSSGVPTALGMIEIIKKMVFIESHHSLNHIIREQTEKLDSYLKRVDNYISKYEIEFNYFIKSTENIFNELITIGMSKNKSNLDTNDEEKLKLLIEDKLYGNWFGKYSMNPKNRQKLIEELVENIEPGGAYILLANLIKKQYITTVFTTNFDDLIYDALTKYFNEKPRVYSHNEVAQYIRFTDNRPNIIKLHGDFLYENIRNIYTETKELDINMQSKFSEAIRTKGLVVIGYNGADESIMNVLFNVRREIPFSIYWCDRSEDKLHWRSKKLINESEDAYFIKIRDFDDFVFELFNYSNEELTINLVSKAKSSETKMKKYLENYYSQRYKRSHKICPEQYGDFGNIEDGTEILNKLKLPSTSIEIKVKYYEIIYNLNPTEDWLINNYAVALIQANDRVEAKRLLQSGIEKNPLYSLFWYNLGVVYHDIDLLEDAKKCFLTATELNRNYANAFCNLAATLNKQREYDKAFDSINKAISLDKKGKYLVNKAIILKNMGFIDEAIQLYDEAILIGDDNVRALLNRANAKRLKSEYKNSLEDSFRALELNPEHEYIYITICQVYGHLQLRDKFYHFFTEALKRNYPIWRHIDDPGFYYYKDEPKFIALVKRYSPINIYS